LPSGVTATYSQWNIAAPGAGNCVVTLHAASNTVPGVYSLTINAQGGGVTKSTPLTLDVPSFTLDDAGISSFAVAQSGTTNVRLNVRAVGGFTSAVSLSVSGVPSGVTATLTPASVTGSGSITLKLVAAANAAVAGSTITVTATGGGITQTVRFTLNVTKH
jgi:uncharacterized membrane protein